MANNRNLTTTRTQVFGDVSCGKQCRVCGRRVEDGRAKTCSDYCRNLVTAVMNMLNWSSVRRQVIDRDDETCQSCGFDLAKDRLARDHIRDLIDEAAGERPDGPSMGDPDAVEAFDWDTHRERRNEWRERREEAKERYGDPYEATRSLEVDHIKRIADGGHPFDPSNLQTLCSECHQDKTASENSEQRRTPSAQELNESLFEYVAEKNQKKDPTE